MGLLKEFETLDQQREQARQMIPSGCMPILSTLCSFILWFLFFAGNKEWQVLVCAVIFSIIALAGIMSFKRPNAKAQNDLGIMYGEGRGVPQNYYTAFKYFQKAAQKGLADAQFNLGIMYYEGKGVPKNYNIAFEWFKKAAQQGHAQAQNNLSVMYRNGLGVY